MTQSVRKEIFEIASEDKVFLNLTKQYKGQYIIKPKIRNLVIGGSFYRQLKWQNQYQSFYISFDDIEKTINFLLSTNFSDSNNKQLQVWLSQLQLLLPKIQQAKQDCSNKSWNWLDIKW